MKHNWEYKKLGEVIDFVGGGTPSKSNKSFYEGSIPWASVRDMSKFELDTTEFCITEEAVRNSATNVLPKGTIVISTHVGLGKICILMQDTAINQDLKGVIFRDSSINKRFFLYWYKSVSDHIISNGKGATVKGVTLDFMKNLRVPIVPKSEQDTIIEELDEINAMIAGRKDQLKELDLLAQSVFYEMFGDPISNPKGWELRNIADVANIKIGPFGSLLHKEDYIKGGTPLINPVHMQNGYVKVDTNFTISDEKKIELANYLLATNDIIFGRRGDIGRCALITPSEDGFLCGTGSLFLRFFIEINPIYSLWVLKSPSIAKFLFDKASGATMLNINCGIIASVPLILPPFEIQSEFAERIEAIEGQKHEIEVSICELQTLLDSRMDYWFN